MTSTTITSQERPIDAEIDTDIVHHIHKESLLEVVRETKEDDMTVPSDPTPYRHPLQDNTGEEITNISNMNNHQSPYMIASNKYETIFLSSAGDVLTSRCRYSPYPSTIATNKPYQWTNDVAVICCDAESVCDTIQISCTPWTNQPQSNLIQENYHRPTKSVPKDGDVTSVSSLHQLHQFHPNHNDQTSPLSGSYNSQRITSTTNNNTTLVPHPASSSSILSSSSPNKVQPSPFHNVKTTFRSPPIALDNISTNTLTTYDHNVTINSHHNFNIDDDDGDDDNNSTRIVPIKSFDYSQINEGGLDMIPESRFVDVIDVVNNGSSHNSINHITATKNKMTERSNNTKYQVVQQQLFHGIPSFLSYFNSISVRYVSANPLGAHVLLISQPGILYAYGLNTYGQLGIGMISDVRDAHQGYIMKPTIVTPLLENGGKSIICAAGVTHSLVVVEMEERRLTKSQSFDMNCYNSNSVTSQQDQSQSNTSRNLTENSIPSKNNYNCHVIHDDTTTATQPISLSDATKHHQVYGFGRNDYMKIGLISPALSTIRSSTTIMTTTTPHALSTKAATIPSKDKADCVPLPHRVALRCSVVQYRNKSNDPYVGHDCYNTNYGIFEIAASTEHSAALVRRPSGDVEFYTWGNATFGTLGLSQATILASSIVVSPTTLRVIPVPTIVPSLSQCSNTTSEIQAQRSLLFRDVNEYPKTMSLSRCCSYVVTSIGRCFAFGTSEDGMLGLGRNVIEAHTPTEITMPDDARYERITSVRAGELHVTIATNSGTIYAWGARNHAGFEIHRQIPVTPSLRKPPTMKGPTPIEDLQQFEWSPRRINFINNHSNNNNTSITKDQSFLAVNTHNYDDDNQYHKRTMNITQIYAGNDCTFFITESGTALSSGKNSGRLGQGDVEHDVTTPKELFGGLHLFQNNPNMSIATTSTEHLLEAKLQNCVIERTKFGFHSRRIASA